jgi:hypothetical protein
MIASLPLISMPQMFMIWPELNFEVAVYRVTGFLCWSAGWLLV